MKLRNDPRVADALLFAADGPFTAHSRYRIDFALDCTGGTAETSVHTLEFTTTESVPLPAEAGTATAGITDRSPYVEINPSLALKPFLPVTMAEVFARGARWGGSPGYGLPGDRPIRFTFGHKYRHDDFCADGDGIKNERAEVRFHVAGAETDPAPLLLDVPVDCASYLRETRPAPSAARSGEPAAAVVGGCTVGAGGTTNATAAATLLLALRLRRRRRP